MSSPQFRTLWIAGFLLNLAASVAEAGPYAPDDAAARMKLAEGFHVEVVAAEPMIRQPVAMNFDTKGRLWVIQYLQYPNPAGLKPVNVDQYLRTVYDRLPEPPPKGPVGLDRITILEDTNADGRADQSKDFVTGLNLASGLAIGYGGVFIAQPPYLLFYPDRDGDDKPDGDPEVLLTGFGMEDSHAFANSLQWGPDGWLYGAQGSTVTANIRGISFQQGIWRYHPITKEFELFAEGGGNTWGLDFDEHGNAIAGTNFGNHAMLHQVQGGYYVKGFAKHGELHNPHAYGYFEHVPYKDFRGGHVTCGGVVYQGGAFPESFTGKYIAANLLSNAIHWHVMEPNGSTFKAHFGGELLVANDPWFRPVDCLVGPEGAVYVADWYDERANHVDPKDDWDKTNGRIYRIVANGSERRHPRDLSSLEDSKLLDLLTDANEWHARTARRILAERKNHETARQLKMRCQDARDPKKALTSLWALAAMGGFDDECAEAMLSSPHADCRVWGVRLACDLKVVSPPLSRRLAELARSEPDVTVRCQLASSAKRLGGNEAMPILAGLLHRDEDAKDPFVPMLLWWALEDKAASDREAVLELFQKADNWNAPLIRDYMVERLARRYAAGGTEADFESCAQLLALAPANEHLELVVSGMEKGLAGRKLEHVPPSLEKPLAKLWSDANPSPTLVRLGVRLGSTTAAATALRMITDPKAKSSARLAMLELLGQIGEASSMEPILELALNKEEAKDIRRAAMTAVQRFSDEQIAEKILAGYGEMEGDLRSNARNLLSSRQPWAGMLLASVDVGKIDPRDFSTDQLKQIALFGDVTFKELIEKHWGKIEEQTPGEIRARIHGINVSLGLAPGDNARGKQLFTKNCANCHTLFGEGNKVGPDLTAADRKNRTFLLTSIVDPSSVIRKEFIPYTIALVDGRLLTGIIVEGTPQTTTILDAKNQRTTLAQDEIEEMKPSSKSLMPDRILDELSAQEVRDLMSYLQSEGH